ncbi:hypothetical protein AAFF_G00330760 [Aldrovandia affinis]|uniref:Uncharacterized protein n=1 Tax=Aldrovandia affinis TaxID=143900 RepID=A0AAD7R787_9TELE|nr:hypothetical protein AAFF_G00330760 [Aldrovandia affinis]
MNQDRPGGQKPMNSYVISDLEVCGLEDSKFIESSQGVHPRYLNMTQTSNASFAARRQVEREPMEEFRMMVHLFGVTSSPSIASYALKRTAEDHKDIASQKPSKQS